MLQLTSLYSRHSAAVDRWCLNALIMKAVGRAYVPGRYETRKREATGT